MPDYYLDWRMTSEKSNNCSSNTGNNK